MEQLVDKRYTQAEKSLILQTAQAVLAGIVTGGAASLSMERTRADHVKQAVAYAIELCQATGIIK